ncbi:hypothetical protein PF005_g14246 [Phytophthora fragariae]|uniref:Uncharacterized protein n=1 Tax=Phytophthora fragariae TaxID=53985 RepID=A0A6A3RTF0_9STRA|nr:hypothetical protein PF011_g13045 [Phytophthora fragariae]KAE9103641.1 hypothetical protein PF007_g14340 [Phytophthora fragariae]KAE9141096.1 hypothetical protein PF006_g13363 [Phytophthora fragariae]KAE9203320.1 hypothetical protein PF005_g14246 [Phytophthora fragariae]KAE9220591.1 hypothetical protein PF004_g13284 [Phytophthora fragariae]
MVWETATTTDERRKIVSKLMPFLRAQTILTNDKFAEIGMRVRPVLSPFELPCIKQLLVAKECGFDVKVYVQRSKYTTQHQKMFIVDILVTTASANPSMNGLTKSFENLTLHFIAEEVDQATQQFSRDLEEDFFEVDQVWLRAEEQQVSSSRQLAAAMASEGPTAEELEALDFQPETDDIISEEVTAIEEFLMEEIATVQELIAEADAPIENHTNEERSV